MNEYNNTHKVTNMDYRNCEEFFPGTLILKLNHVFQ